MNSLPQRVAALDQLIAKVITLREFENLCALPPKESDPDLIFECEQDAEYFRDFESGEAC